MRPDLIKHKLTRSEETLRDAKILASANSWNGVVNRLYYAAFYAVSAALLQKGVEVKTHSSQKSKFNENFIKAGLVKRETGEVYNILFNYRQEGDYTDFVIFTKEKAEPLIERTENLINEIKKLINE